MLHNYLKTLDSDWSLSRIWFGVGMTENGTFRLPRKSFYWNRQNTVILYCINMTAVIIIQWIYFLIGYRLRYKFTFYDCINFTVFVQSCKIIGFSFLVKLSRELQNGPGFQSYLKSHCLPLKYLQAFLSGWNYNFYGFHPNESATAQPAYSEPCLLQFHCLQ